MIYRLKFDRNQFLTFDITPEEMIEKLGPNYFFMLDEPLWANFWPSINGSFFNDSEGKKIPSVPDITVWFTQHLVLNTKAKESLVNTLGDRLATLGELLPIQCEGIDYFILHVAHTINDEAVDEAVSSRVVEASGHIELSSLAFNDSASTTLLFHTRYDDKQGLFCSDEFKTIVEDAGLKGVLFDTNLASIF